MNDDPVSLLNLEPEPVATGRSGRWWIAALVVPVVVAGLGILAAVCLPESRRDLGTALMVAGGGVILALLLCVGLATVSVAKNEVGRILAVLAAVPCLVLLAWAASLLVRAKWNERKQEESNRQRMAYVQQLQAEPETGLRENWAGSGDPVRAQVFTDSLRDFRTHYSSPQLQRIYDAMPAQRAAVLRNPACTAEFLTACFPAAWAEARQYDYPMLAAIIEHPNTPLALVETVAHSATLPQNAVRDAKFYLDRRKPLRPRMAAAGPARIVYDPQPAPSADPFEQFRHFETAAAGKYIGLRIKERTGTSPSAGTEVDVLNMPGAPERTAEGELFILPGNYDFKADPRLASLAFEFTRIHNQEVLKLRGK